MRSPTYLTSSREPGGGISSGSRRILLGGHTASERIRRPPSSTRPDEIEPWHWFLRGNLPNCLHARAKRVADRSTLLVKLHDATIRLDRLERQSVLAAEDAQRPRFRWRPA